MYFLICLNFTLQSSSSSIFKVGWGGGVLVEISNPKKEILMNHLDLSCLNHKSYHHQHSGDPTSLYGCFG